MPYFFFNSKETMIQKFEEKDRDEWQKPDRVIDYLLLKKGDSVADIGAGSGYFTLPLARKVGDSGKAYAVDVDKTMLDHVDALARKEKRGNIVTVLAKPDDPLLANSSQDMIFICNTYWYIDRRDLYLARLKEVLKKDGRLAIISYRKESTPFGPPLNKRIARDEAVEEVTGAGFRLEAEYFFLPYQYYLVFSK